MKVLYIINGLGFSQNTGIGGSDKRAIEMIRNLKEFDKEGKYDILTTDSGVKIFKMNEGLKTNYYEIKRPIWWVEELSKSLIGRIISYFYATFASVGLMNSLSGYDYYYATSDFFSDLIPAYVFKLLGKKKMVCFVHHRVGDPLTREGSIFINIVLEVLQSLSFVFINAVADTVLLYKTPEGKSIREKYFKNKKVYFVKNGINKDLIDEVSEQEKKYEACFVGGIRHSKGIEDFIPIWKKVVEKFPRAKFLIIGGGSQSTVSKLKKKVKSAGLDSNILFTGPLAGKEVFEKVKQSKLFLFPSREEGWGIALCEAMYCGLPVVSYNLPAFAAFGSGLDMFEIGKAGLLAAKVIDYLKSENRIQKKGAELNKIASEFTWPNIAEEEFEIYKRIKLEQ